MGNATGYLPISEYPHFELDSFVLGLHGTNSNTFPKICRKRHFVSRPAIAFFKQATAHIGHGGQRKFLKRTAFSSPDETRRKQCNDLVTLPGLAHISLRLFFTRIFSRMRPQQPYLLRPSSFSAQQKSRRPCEPAGVETWGARWRQRRGARFGMIRMYSPSGELD